MSKFRLFPHQEEAIGNLNSFFVDSNKALSGIISIPTGGGKTFVAVQWILAELEKKDRKIIWLAQSFELLNQAYNTFSKNSNINKIRIISSHSDHSSVNDINEDDRILIISTQTAIQAIKQIDGNFSRFIEKNKNDNIIVVLDEAHHAPAYGCRTFLLQLKERSIYLWLLGLTATPTYTDIKRRGWLWKIFDGGVIYQIGKALLQRERILAKENIIRRKTPIKIKVDDELFNVLVRQHRDIPEHIIEEIASNSERNNFIVNEYLSHRIEYGKTIIFLDRWFQCLYVKDKLRQNGVKADAIFYKNDSRKEDKSGQSLTNKQVIDQFRQGKIDVLLNVKMLTEGADIPDISTVFITRDTTSHIFLQQMIGRALRGERSGGKKEIANIVLFGDNWDKTIAWANPESEGDIDSDRIRNKSVPSERISIVLLEQLVKSITFESIQLVSFMDMIPIGWYQTEYVVFEPGMEFIELVRETVLIYSNTKDGFNLLIEDEIIHSDVRWSQESLSEYFAHKECERIIKHYFNDVPGYLLKEVTKGIIAVCRHVAQNRSIPEFYTFENRESCNLEDIAEKVINLPPALQYQQLLSEYNKPGTIWKSVYPNFYHFKTANDMYINKLLFSSPNKMNGDINIASVDLSIPANEKVTIQAIKTRDNNTCGRCGLTSKETKLDVDEILPSELFGGAMQMSNMQTICTRCKRINDTSHINFINHISSQIPVTTFIGDDFDLKYEKNIIRIKAALKGSINALYRCGAIFDIYCSRRKNSLHYSTWTIILYGGNSSECLQREKANILLYINKYLNQRHVRDIKIQVVM